MAWATSARKLRSPRRARLGRLHAAASASGTEARNVATFGARPDDQLTESIRLEFEKAKALFERALALHEAVGRKDAMAADYSPGDLYSATRTFDQAQR